MSVIKFKKGSLFILGSKIKLDSEDKFNELFDLLGDNNIVTASEIHIGYIAFENMLFDFDDSLINEIVEGKDIEVPYIGLVSDCGNKDFIKWYN